MISGGALVAASLLCAPYYPEDRDGTAGTYLAASGVPSGRGQGCLDGVPLPCPDGATSRALLCSAVAPDGTEKTTRGSTPDDALCRWCLSCGGVGSLDRQ